MSRLKKSGRIVVAVPFFAFFAMCAAAYGQVLTLNPGNTAGNYGTPYGWLGPNSTKYWEEYRKGDDGYTPLLPAVTGSNLGTNQVLYQNVRQGVGAHNVFTAPGMFVGPTATSVPMSDQFYLVGATNANNTGINGVELRLGFGENNASGGGPSFSQFITTNHGGDNSNGETNAAVNNSQDMYMQNWGVDGAYLQLTAVNTGPTWAVSKVVFANLVAAGSAENQSARTNYVNNVAVTGGSSVIDTGVPSTTPLSLNWGLSGSGANTQLQVVVGGKEKYTWTFDDTLTSPGNPDGVAYQNNVLDLSHVVPIMTANAVYVISPDPQPPTTETIQMAQVDVWTGAHAGGAWDNNVTQNWQVGGTPVNYNNSDSVQFDDTATGTTNVTVAAGGVTPSTIVVNNSTLPYTITSAAGAAIGGTGQLLKSGTNNVTFSGPNTFGGGAIISAGNVLLGSSSAGSPGALTSGPIGTGTVSVGDTSGTNNAGLLFATTASGASVGNNIALQTGNTGTASLGGLNGSGTNTFSGQVILGSGGVTGHGVTLTAAASGEVDFTGNIVREANDATAGVTVTNSTGTGTAIVNISGNNTYGGGTTINSGAKLVANAPQNLGTGPVTFNNGGTLRVGTAAAAASLGTTGFGGNGVGWEVNNNGNNFSTPITGNVLTLTDNNGDEARSAFLNTALPVVSGANGFTASFVYTPSNANLPTAGDGIAFILQNDTRGTNALGDLGGGLGYGANPTGAAAVPIQPSAAVELNIFNGHTIGTNAVTNGAVANYNTTGSVNLASGDPIKVDLAYNATTHTLTETLTDTTNTTLTSTATYTNYDVAGTLGSNFGIVGFSGGTGGAFSTQTISNFTYGVATGYAAGSYANPMAITAGATAGIEVGASAAIPTVTVGPLTVNAGAASTLNVTPGADVPAAQAYGLNIGPIGLAGSLTVNVANNGTGLGTVTPGIVSGAGGLTKTGPGALVLAAGTHTYSGDTNVNGGTLVVNGTLNAQASNVNINTGGTLKGSGTINRNVNVNSGGTWSPGNSPGTQTAASATWASGGTYQWELNQVAGSGLQTTGVDPGGDLIALNGNLTVSATAASKFNVAITSLTTADVPGPVAGWNSGGTYQWVIASSNGLSLTNGNDSLASRFNLDTSEFTPFNVTSGAGFSIQPDLANPNDVLLTYDGAGTGSGVPEPSSFVLTGMAAVGFLVWRRKRIRGAVGQSRPVGG